MADLDWRDYIVSDEGVLAGKPIVKGTRLSVELVLELLAAGWDRAALRESSPQLTEERIRAVLAYAAASFRDERFYLLPPVATSRSSPMAERYLADENFPGASVRLLRDSRTRRSLHRHDSVER